jgi:hypothetical protein
MQHRDGKDVIDLSNTRAIDGTFIALSVGGPLGIRIVRSRRSLSRSHSAGNLRELSLLHLLSLHHLSSLFRRSSRLHPSA